MPVTDVIIGAIKLIGLPDRARFDTWQDFITALPSFLSVEVPKGATGIFVSDQQPSEDDRDRLWIRRDRSGGFVGIYVFVKGNWRPFYQFAKDPFTQVIWVIGDSTNIPEGFVLIAPGDAIIPSNVVNTITAQFVPNSAGGYIYFALRYEGF